MLSRPLPRLGSVGSGMVELDSRVDADRGRDGTSAQRQTQQRMKRNSSQLRNSMNWLLCLCSHQPGPLPHPDTTDRPARSTPFCLRGSSACLSTLPLKAQASAHPPSLPPALGMRGDEAGRGASTQIWGVGLSCSSHSPLSSSESGSGCTARKCRPLQGGREVSQTER